MTQCTPRNTLCALFIALFGGRVVLHASKSGGVLECLHPPGAAEWLWPHHPRGESKGGVNRRELLPDDPRIHVEWRRLVITHAVIGVQVHDARLVAAMHIHGLTHLLTLDQKDFSRYQGISVVHPRQVVKS